MTGTVLALNWEDGLGLFLLFYGVGVDIFFLYGFGSGLRTIVVVAVVVFKKFQSILIILNSFRLNSAVCYGLTPTIFHLAFQSLSETRTQR